MSKNIEESIKSSNINKYTDLIKNQEILQKCKKNVRKINGTSQKNTL